MPSSRRVERYARCRYHVCLQTGSLRFFQLSYLGAFGEIQRLHGVAEYHPTLVQSAMPGATH